ncbi:DUF1491 family protein [Martelella sp. AD-3]|uniref:DUF1491 family protein n=1 Tax=Martelella sp. AD-3 TaxID=686597 RepID=UPI000463D917|nr:DUF1491 family protein [Martelella sp. AD-3]AMM85032.1 hypothetical protein AZF01_12225 [Martelella sp. AD-3]MAM09021.1 DUF1491 domain-containing protein [Rhizobiaceae bacterium]
MRLKSEIFVSALLRRVFANGDFAVVERKGAADAGAIAIRQVLRNGQECLYMPAPQFFTAESSEDRLFEQRLDRVPADDVAARLEKEIRFDGDLWVVVLETESVEGLFAVAGDGV